MPDTACLHIQARDSDPIRVVELPGTSVRIGRASYCEVRLSEPDLAEEECRLKRRGGSWQLVPGRVAGSIWLEGRTVEEACPLPFDVPFRVGEHWLTLRPTGGTGPDWRGYQTPQPASTATIVEDFRAAPYRAPAGPDGPARPGPAMGPSPAPSDEPDHLSRWKERQEQRASRIKAGQGEKRWEERWRAAGERLRARAATGSPPLSPSRSVPPVPTESPAYRREPAGGAEPRTWAGHGPATPDARFNVPDPPPVPAPLPPPSTALAMLEPPAAPAYVPPVISPGEVDAVISADELASPSSPEPEAEREPVDAAAPEVEESTEPVASAGPHELPPVVDVLPGEGSRPAPAAEPPGGGILEDDSEFAVALAETRAGAEPEPAVEEAVDSATEGPDEADSPGIGETPAPELSPAEPVAEAADPELAPEVPARRGLFSRTRFLWSSATRELRLQPSQEDADAPVEQDVSVTPPEPVPPIAAAPTVPDDDDLAAPSEPPPGAGPDRRLAVTGPTRSGGHESNGQHSQAVEPTAAHDVEEVAGRGAGPGRKPPRPMPSVQGPAARTRQATSAPKGTPGGTKPSDRRRTKAAGEPGPAPSSRDWPTVSDILAAHRAEAVRAAPPRAAPRPPVSRAIPTEARQPDHWSLPAWLGLPPALLTTIAAGSVVIGLSWAWAVDARSTAVVAGLLAQPGNEVKPLPESLAAPSTGWWRSTASNLVRWALYYDRLAASDPVAGEQAEEMLATAARSSPLQAQVRFALARRPPKEGEAAEELFASVGLSRDVEALAWSARQWHRAGRPGPAVKAYRAALEMAARADLSRLPLPTFDDDPRVQRYRMPGEELVSPVVRGMAEQQGWTFAAWSEALPDSALVWLTAARVLREQGHPDAEKALDSVVASLDSRAPEGCSASVHRAAQAEALALKQRWKEAEARYREAIELERNDAVRRSWWMNLAAVDQKLLDEPARQKALESAKGNDANDEIAQRAIDRLKFTGIQREGARASR